MRVCFIDTLPHAYLTSAQDGSFDQGQKPSLLPAYDSHMHDDRFNPRMLAEYLRQVHRAEVGAVRVTPLGGGRQGDKGYGYGIPLRVDYELAGAPRRAVVESVRPGPSGHEHMADRAQ